MPRFHVTPRRHYEDKTENDTDFSHADELSQHEHVTKLERDAWEPAFRLYVFF